MEWLQSGMDWQEERVAKAQELERLLETKALGNQCLFVPPQADD
jgi:hypothetical protein